MIGVPTSTMVPASKCSFVTVPAYGEGSSTAALAVSTSHSGWLTVTVSPTATSHWRISPSVRPSPTSGSLNWRSVALGDVMGSELQGAVDGVEHPVQVGQVLLFQLRGRVRGAVAADAQDRRFQRVETGLGDPGGDLRPDPQRHGGLVDDDAATGAADGLEHRVEVERRDSAQVDHLERAALLGRRLRRL